MICVVLKNRTFFSDSREYVGKLAYNGMGFVVSWLVLKHLLRGFQACHVANKAQKFF